VRWALIGLLLASACAERVRPQVVVRIDADDAIAERARWLRVRVTTQEGDEALDRVVELGDEAQLPASVPLTPRDGDPTRAWAVEAELFATDAEPGPDDEGFALRRAAGRYVDGVVLEVPLRFDAACTLRCPDGQTCRGGVCVGACVDVEAGDGRPTCGECEICEGASCVASDALSCGCAEDRCFGGRCVVERPVDRVAAALNVTCATIDRALYCFGENGASELGLSGGGAFESTPALVSELPSGVRDLDLGGFAVVTVTAFGCVSLDNGEVRCWGRTGQGRAGPDDSATPLAVPLDAEVAEVATGGTHTCFRSPDRQLYCIGRANEGQLGRAGAPGATTDTVPVPVDTAWVQADAGYAHACAVDAEGAVWCWGFNSDQELGVPGDTVNRDAPVRAELGSSDFTEVALGAFHSCALRRDGRALCWGGAAFGNLGRLDVERGAPPGEVSLSAPLESLHCGRSHCCGVGREGALYCWGRNHHGQLGKGSISDGDALPEVVGEGMRWRAAAGGELHTCAIREDGALFCWGANAYGQLGLGDTEERYTPNRVCFP